MSKYFLIIPAFWVIAMQGNAQNFTEVPFDSDRWSRQSQAIEIEGKKGWKCDGDNFLKDFTLGNGIIEFDFVVDSAKQSRTGVMFRGQDEINHELIYLRIKNSGLKEATQYMPIIENNGPWRLYESEQGKADFNPGWNHLKLILEGSRATLFINYK